MFTNALFGRIFKIRHRDSIGTAFALEHEGCQYLVTAKHCVQEIVGDTSIGIFIEGKWQPLQIKLTGHGGGSVDVSVLSPSIQLAPTYNPSRFKPTGASLGDDVYFLGYPLGLHTNFFEYSSLPLPIIKKAYLSGVIGDPPNSHFLLDGHNNRGFSGGPVVTHRIDERKPEGGTSSSKWPGRIYGLLGIISAFRVEMERAYEGDTLSNTIQVPTNSGLMIVFPAGRAIEIIQENPNGIEVEFAKD